MLSICSALMRDLNQINEWRETPYRKQLILGDVGDLDKILKQYF